MSTKYVSGRVKELKVGVSNYSESKESLSVVGIVSATKFYGDGSNLTGTSTPGIDPSATSDFTNINVAGVSTFAGNINANGNIVGDDSTNISGIASVTATTFYGDGSNLTGTQTPGVDPDATSTFKNLRVTGISTFENDLDIESSVLITGITTIGGLVDINAGGQANTFKVEDLTDNRVVIAGAGGELEDSANLTFNGTQFNVGSGVTIYHATGIVSATKFYGDGSNLTGTQTPGVDPSATSDFTNINVAGVSTFGGNINANGNIIGDGSTDISGISSIYVANEILHTGDEDTTITFNPDQISLLVGDTLVLSAMNNPGTHVGVIIQGDDGLSAPAVKVGTAVTIDGGTGIITATTFKGALVASSAKVSDLTSGRVVYAGASGELQDSANLTFNGTTLTAGAFAGDGSQLTNLPGIDTAGGSVFNNILSSGINTFGKGANGKTFLYDADSLKFQTTGIGVSVSSGTGKTAYIEGPEEIWIDPHPAGVGTTSGIVRIRGDLYVDGKEVIIDVDKLEIGDFQIGIASTAGTNAALDGAGIGIGSTGIRKTITWNNATSALMCSENWNLGSGKHYEIAGTDVLTATTLGSGVVNSSLTSLGTIASLTASTATVNGNLKVTGISTFVGVSTFNNNATFDRFILVPDGTQDGSSGGSIRIGDSQDMQIFHYGNNGQIRNDTGMLRIRGSSTNSSSIRFDNTVGEVYANMAANGSVDLYFDNAKKFETTTTGVTVTGTCQATDFNSTSDIRLKDNIQVIEDPLAKIVQIEGVSFNWKENNKPALGVIADQVQEILPELVTDGDPKTVNYNGLIGLLIEAVKEQQIQINELKSKLS